MRTETHLAPSLTEEAVASADGRIAAAVTATEHSEETASFAPTESAVLIHCQCIPEQYYFQPSGSGGIAAGSAGG